jgi:hypothetical protein
MSVEFQPSEISSEKRSKFWQKKRLARKAFFILVVFLAGFSGGYFSGRQSLSTTESPFPGGGLVSVDEIYPPEGYTISAKFGNSGPQLLAAGAIDLQQFTELYQQVGSPLTDEQRDILTKGSGSPIVINEENAYFLLNFFWALGLTNQNPILTDGPMMSRGWEQAGNFASTGGWTLGTKASMDLYASVPILHLTKEQQERLLKVASVVYRPCCDNPTHFPDCNHGMAMLGLLELMASQDASEADMFNAAKYVNAYWFPQQTLEIATLLKSTQGVDFARADASQVVSNRYSSASGFSRVHQWLGENGLLEQSPNRGGSCGVQ